MGFSVCLRFHESSTAWVQTQQRTSSWRASSTMNRCDSLLTMELKGCLFDSDWFKSDFCYIVSFVFPEVIFMLKAPSASLCVAILTLHSDHAACGQQLIGHCRSLSRKLTNPEVDARLLTDVMRQLLFSAKLMFVNAGCSHEPALCDKWETHTFTCVF